MCSIWYQLRLKRSGGSTIVSANFSIHGRKTDISKLTLEEYEGYETNHLQDPASEPREKAQRLNVTKKDPTDSYDPSSA
jgi:hypothetical protein